MSEFKIVSVFTSNFSEPSKFENAFIPDRNFHKRFDSKIKLKGRCQSAPFYSCIQPINTNWQYLKPRLQSANPTCFYNDFANNKKFETEINSAVNLMQSRSNLDLCDSSNSCKTIKTQSAFLDKNTVINPSSRLNVSQRRRWKSAVPNIDSSKQTNKKISIENLQLLSNKIQRKSLNSSKTTKIVETNSSIKSHDFTPDQQKELITSNSNFISHYITIDDVENVKKKWNSDIQENINTKLDTLCKMKMKLEDTKDKTMEVNNTKMSAKQHKRSELLREFMDIYIDWKGCNRMMMMDRQKFGRSQSSLGVMNNAQHRVNTFNNIIKEKRREIEMNTTIDDRKNGIDRRRRDDKMRKGGFDNKDYFNDGNLSVDAANFSKRIKVKSNKISLNNEVLEVINEDGKDCLKESMELDESTVKMDNAEEESETVSEIDWLECSDL